VRRTRPQPFWRDKERRRALLLSLLLHLAALLALVWLYVTPRPLEPEEFIVLELDIPEASEAQVDAPTADDPAPQAPTPQVAGSANAPQAFAPPTPQEFPRQEAPRQEAQPAEPPPTPPSPEVARTPPVSPPAPPQARVPEAGAARPLPQLPAQAPTTTLPEIEEAEVAPQPLAESIPLPRPNPRAQVAPARTLALTPRVQIMSGRAVPQPEVQASVVTRDVPVPQVRAAATPAQPLPQPEVQTSVATREVSQPQARAAVAPTQPVPQPQADAEVAAPQAVPQPQVGAAVAPAQAVPQPQAQASVPAPRPLEVAPGVQVSEATPLPAPEATATVTLPEPEAPEPAEGTVQAEAPSEGDAARAGQTQADEDARADATGAAAAPGGAEALGAPELQTFQARLEQPLAVILDNADAAYPQSGLLEASSIFEMPVEGGLTRLMSVYTRTEPTQVGPIRSARDYFLDTVLNMGGTLVHVGGAPSTVSRIETQGLATVDALQEGALFSQAEDREAPHSTYAVGSTLREAVSRLNPGGRALSGTVFRPAEEAPGAENVSVAYSADYTSGFRYLPEVDQYRWLRNGAVAADASGEDVLVDAVVVARVTAFPYPDDPAGRLYLPLDGGEATLYMDGKAVPGRWNPTGGFQFVTEGDQVVDLTPFKHWILYVPEYADVSVQ